MIDIHQYTIGEKECKHEFVLLIRFKDRQYNLCIRTINIVKYKHIIDYFMKNKRKNCNHAKIHYMIFLWINDELLDGNLNCICNKTAIVKPIHIWYKIIKCQKFIDIKETA